MLGVLYQTVLIGVYGAGHSLAYAAPLAAFAGAFSALYLNYDIRPVWLFAALAAALGFLTLYIMAALRAMLYPEAPPPFSEAWRFRRRHIDFLAFSAATFIVLGLLIFALIYTVGTLYVHIEGLENAAAEPPQTGEEYGYGEGSAEVLLYGSRLFTFLSFIAAFILWGLFFRIFIKMPAYADGFEISSGEALDLTSSYRRHILIMSVFLNAAFVAVINALPWGEFVLWVKIAAVECAVWACVHLNLAFSVAAYRRYTEGYSMRPVRY